MEDPRLNASDDERKVNEESMEEVDIGSSQETAESGLKPKKSQAQFSTAQFLFTCVGFAVGLGNFWRFPKMLQDNGGSVFVIPYFIMFFLGGVPLLFLEISLGQLLRKPNLSLWSTCHPSWKGIGIAGMVCSFVLGAYYNSILAWVLYYLYNSFSVNFPWASCPDPASELFPGECESQSPPIYFWYRQTLNATSSIEESGGIQLHLLLCLLIAWFLVAAAMWKGVQSLSKVTYVTTGLPYICLIILTVQAVQLKGAGYGLQYLLSPKTEKLLDPKVWLNAATQIFFSLSLGFGGMISFAADNNEKTDIISSTWIIALINSLTSIWGCLIVFMIQGFSAENKYQECLESNMVAMGLNGTINGTEHFKEYLTSTYGNMTHGFEANNLTSCSVDEHLNKSVGGSGLAFIVFADCLSSFGSLKQVSAVCFFLMLLSLGLASMFGNIEGVIKPMANILTLINPRMKNRPKLTLVFIIFISALLSSLFILGSGSYWVDVFDLNACSIPLLVIAVCELVAGGYSYGFDRLFAKLRTVNKVSKFGEINEKYFRLMIKFVSPICLVFVFIFFVYDKFTTPWKYSAYSYAKGFEELYYSSLHKGIGVFLTSMVLGGIPIMAIFSACSPRRSSYDVNEKPAHPVKSTSRV